MDFLTLSLPEAAYLYLALAIQAMVRASSLRRIPLVLVLIWTLVLLGRGIGRPGGVRAVIGPVIGYLATALVLLILFWPECTPFGRLTGQTTGPTQIASYAALNDPGAEVITAADTRQVPPALQQPALVAPGFRMLLRAITETPLALARTINSQTHRTFSGTMPMQWLLGVDLTTDVTNALADWVHNCYLPVQTGTMEGQEGRSIEELLPWGDTPLRRGLATREVVPGAQTGISWLRGPNPNNTVRCDMYLEAVEFRTQAWLFELRSPKGTPLTEVFQEALGLDSVMQARFLVYREMLRAAGPAVPAPSLTAAYGTLRGAGVLGATVGEGGAGGFLSLFNNLPFFGKGSALGAATGAIRGLAGEFQRLVDSLSWLVGIAVFLTWWAPYIVGLINLVLVGLFPFVLLWALIPGTQFQPLANYFIALLFTSSAPLWWALIDQAQRIAGITIPPATPGYAAGVSAMLSAFAWSTVVTVLGILLVPVVTAILLFTVFRAVGSLWRGAV